MNKPLKIGLIFTDAQGHKRQVISIRCGYLITRFVNPQGKNLLEISEYKKL